MLVSTILNLVFIPVLYVILSGLLARIKPRTKPEGCAEEAVVA